jgi:hypothetical protein
VIQQHYSWFCSSPLSCFHRTFSEIYTKSDAHSLFLCWIHRESHQARYTTSNKRAQRISTSTQLHEILCTYSQDMLVLSSTVTSC